MRSDQSLFALSATAVTGFVLAGFILLSADMVSAADQPKPTGAPPASQPHQPAQQQSGGATCTCPDSQKPQLFLRPKFADLKAPLDESDEIAALESVQVALSELGDGGTYVWHRQNGRLSGVVQPTTSFKDTSGKVCRHVVLMLTTGATTKKAEGIACRLDNGQWQLEG